MSQGRLARAAEGEKAGVSDPGIRLQRRSDPLAAGVPRLRNVGAAAGGELHEHRLQVVRQRPPRTLSDHGGLISKNFWADVRGLRSEQNKKRNVLSAALADLPRAGEMVNRLSGPVA